LIERTPPQTTAGDLYVGRAFAESKSVASLVEGDLYVVSAGLGLLRETDMAPKYDLTIGAKTNGNLRAAMVAAGFTPAQWWDALSKRRGISAPLNELVRSLPGSLILLALPASYLGMVSNDLALIRGATAQRLRIFTSEAGRSVVPDQLQH